ARRARTRGADVRVLRHVRHLHSRTAARAGRDHRGLRRSRRSRRSRRPARSRVSSPTPTQRRNLMANADLMHRYKQHPNDPDLRLKRHLKLARQLGLHPLDLIDTKDREGMAAAVEAYLAALDAEQLRR